MAAELARRLGVPHVELDALHHGPNWQEASAEELRARVEAVLDDAQGWVADGNYEGKLGTLVLDRAELVVWLDLPLRVKLRRLWRRTVHRIRGREELWNGNRESWRSAFWGAESLFAWTVRTHFANRRRWPALLEGRPVVRLRSPAEVERFLGAASPPRQVPPVRRTPLPLLLAGSFALLASLYLPWQSAPCTVPARPGALGVLQDYGCPRLDGFSAEVGSAAAVVAVLLAALAAAAWARRSLERRFPIGRLAVLAAYLGIAVGAQTRAVAHEPVPSVHLAFHATYGAYLGVAAAILLTLAAGALRRRELMLRNAGAAAAILLLIALLLPWQRYAWPTHTTFLGVASPAASGAAALALWLAGSWWRTEDRSRSERLALTGGAALLTGAVFSPLMSLPRSDHASGAWLGLGAAAALVALALFQGVPAPRPSWHGLGVAAAAALFLSSLFLPWQEACYAQASELGPLSGRCLSISGWTTPGTAAALVALVLVLAAVAPHEFRVPAPELTLGFALLVSTLGLRLSTFHSEGGRITFGYGSTVGFVGAAFLVALTARRARLPPFDRGRAFVRLVPIVSCVGYVTIVALPWWGVLPERLQRTLAFAPLSWPTIAGALVGLCLLGSWIRQVVRESGAAPELVLLPLVLLALTALDLVRLRDRGLSWGGGIVVALGVLLTLLGHVEERDGLERLRVPEILRVDRL